MRSKKTVNILCLGTLSASWLFAAPITITVNDFTDTHLSTLYGGQFGAITDLRGALNQINLAPNPNGYIINFNPSATSSISLGAMLPILNLVQAYPLTIDGGEAPITIDGGGAYRGLFARQGSISLKNLKIQNVTAKGGNGGVWAGGGMGAGAALFIDSAQVSISKIFMSNTQTNGGNGGSSVLTDGLGGGGGMGGNGSGNTGDNAFGGGGGLGGDGGIGSIINQVVAGGGGINCGGSHSGKGGGDVKAGQPGGGVGGGPAGGSGNISVGGDFGGGGGAAYVAPDNFNGGGGGTNGSNGTDDVGGNGGYGGGGGGCQNRIGGKGGFGGGGGSGPPAGDGGFGGGGGGFAGTGGFGGGGGGGAGIGGVGGGNGGSNTNNPEDGGPGGGGAGFGGAIFVNAPGSLTILDAFQISNSTTSAGTGYAPGWAAGNDCFFVTNASITLDPNGSTITISNSIADDSAASFLGVQPGTTAGTATGASITIGHPQHSPGIVQFPTTNNSTYSGPTLVRQGIFAVNGSIMSPVSVFRGATLQGTGTVKNSVMIDAGGTIHAGNSIGTITIGTLTLANQAKLTLDINLDPESSISSHYIVNGSVFLQTPTLVLAFASQNSPPTTHTYNFIQSTGNVTGTFNPLVLGAPIGLFGTVNYFPHLVQLQLSPFSAHIGKGVDLSHNEKVILKYLLTLSTVPILQPILTDLALLSPDALRAALDSISPARNATAAYFSNQTAFAMGKIPLDRLAEGRIQQFIRSSSKKNSIAAALSIQSDELLAMAEPLPIANAPTDYVTDNQTFQKPRGRARYSATDQKNYGFWGAGFGDFLSQDKQHTNPKITDTASGMMLGFDYYGYQNGIFTLTTGYVHNDISEECCAGSGTSNGGVLSFYGLGNIGNGYIEGGFLGDYNRFHVQRNIVLTGPLPFHATAESSFNTWTVMPHFSGGYDWMMDWGIVEPFGSIDWAITFQESYKEKGAAPLNDKIKSQNPSILRSQLGINFYETWECEKHAFLFQQSASYINKALFSTKMSAAIILTPTAVPAGAPSSFTVWTYDQTLNLGGISGELFYKHKPSGFFVSGTYQGEFGTSFMSNDITGMLGVFF